VGVRVKVDVGGEEGVDVDQQRWRCGHARKW
jgi:hypothetical protein